MCEAKVLKGTVTVRINDKNKEKKISILFVI